MASISKSNRAIISKASEFDQAIITSFVKYQDSDCIVRLFTKRFGRMVAFFRGGLKVKKNSSPIQAPALAQVGFKLNRSLSRISSIDIDPNSYQLAYSMKKFVYASYMAEIIEKILPEEDSAPEIFSMAFKTFQSLNKSTKPNPCLLRTFELHILKLCGYLPQLPDCDEEFVAFDPYSCTFTSDSNKNFIPFSKEAAKLANSMLIAKIGSINYEHDQELLMIGRLFQNRIRSIGIKNLKSISFLKQLKTASDW